MMGNKSKILVLILIVVLLLLVINKSNDCFKEKALEIKQTNQELKERIEANKAVIEALNIQIEEARVKQFEIDLVMAESNFDFVSENIELFRNSKGR